MPHLPTQWQPVGAAGAVQPAKACGAAGRQHYSGARSPHRPMRGRGNCQADAVCVTALAAVRRHADAVLCACYGRAETVWAALLARSRPRPSSPPHYRT